MDTNLKKSHKLTVFTIALCILIPALMVTCLYPRTGVAMEKLREKYEQSYGEYTDTLAEWCVERNMVNYAVEASYYMYGFVLQECENRAVNFSVLDEYGWDSDYHTIISDCEYLAVYQDVIDVPEISLEIDYMTGNKAEAIESSEELIEEKIEEIDIQRTENESVIVDITDSVDEYEKEDVLAAGSNPDLMPLLSGVMNEDYLQEMDEAGIKAYLIMEFDAYGKLAVADLKFTSDNVRYYNSSVYSAAKASVEQYKNNVKGYYMDTGAEGDYYQVIPKNFKVVFLIDETSGFIFQENYNPYYVYHSERLYLETGVVFLIAGIALLVAILALLLPFIKALNTGWERLFSMYFEVVVCLGVLGCIFHDEYHGIYKYL